MSLKRSNRPADKSNKTERSASDEKVRKTRITNSSRELNKNEEQTSPSGKNRASEQWNQMSQDRDRSAGRATPPTEKPDVAARQWNQGTMERNQTTGSNTPGSEISDRKNPTGEQWNQTSRDQYPTNSKSSPASEKKTPEKHNQELHEGRKSYTGNSERTGQQYSVKDNSSLITDKDLKSRHPANDQQKSHEQELQKRSQSANKGMKQQRSGIKKRDDAQRKENELNDE